MPARMIVAYAIIVLMAAAGVALFLYLSREWRAHRRHALRDDRSRRDRARARRVAEQGTPRPRP